MTTPQVSWRADKRMPVESRTIAQLARALRTQETTSEELTERCLAEIADKNPTLNAFIVVLADEALAEARAADREIAAGRYRGTLHGVPISLKDLLDVRGTPTTAASKVRAGHIAKEDAPSVAHLREAGAVFVGKCNLHEFAFGTTNEDSAFGPARNPIDVTRSPGGSSGGSAIAVATGMSFASIGTDTGGSIRIPAAACGVVGLKPGYGEVSTHGVVPLSRTMDHVGPLCRSVEDSAILYDVLRGAPAAHVPKPRDLAGIRIGIPRQYFLAVLDPQVASVFQSACEGLRGAGAVLEDVTIPHANDIAPIYLHIVLAEAAAYHAKTLDSRPDDYTPNVRLRLEMGRYILAEDYVRALSGREVLRQEVNAALAGHDALFLPALAIPAPKLGVPTVTIGSTEEPVRNITLRLTQLFNLTRHPALAVPCGQTAEGLPVGAQLVGHAGRTHDLLQLGRSVELYLASGASR
jgi:aspartyl-tRNA(Asn)/glutamyl-tRNA(Gln) amidotransferase subunit A